MMTQTDTMHDVDTNAAVTTTPSALPPVLPEPNPMPMPDQDLAISPAVTKIIGCVRWPGSLLRSALRASSRRVAKGTE